MSEQLDKEGCFLVGLCMVVVLLIIYALVDGWSDKRDESYIRDLQRRVWANWKWSRGDDRSNMDR